MVSHSYSRGQPSHVYWDGGWVGPTDGLHVVAKRKIPVPARNQTTILQDIDSNFNELTRDLSIRRILSIQGGLRTSELGNENSKESKKERNENSEEKGRRQETNKGRKMSLCYTKYHAMKTYWGSGIQLYAFLSSAPAGGEWSASRADRFTLRERAPGTHWTVGWVVPRTGLDAVGKRKFPTIATAVKVIRKAKE
jgi:hypothetical protein